MVFDQELLVSTFNALDAHVAALDADGTIILVNEAWRRFARDNGLDPDRAGPGASYLAACDRARGEGEEEGHAAAAGIRAVLAGERDAFYLPYTCHSRSERRWYVLRVRRFEHQEKVWAVAAHEDVTEPRTAEEETIKARAKAEAASRTKDQLLAVLGHELRTPLTPVLLRVSGMLHDPNILPYVRSSLEKIQSNMELEARLIEDVLDMSRVSRDRLELVFEITDVRDALESALDLFSVEIEKKELQVELHLNARNTHVQADRARLRQVFWNHISNAVKYTAPGGRITVAAFNKRGGRIAVQVSDSGMGFEPEFLPRLFAPFEQGDRAVTRHMGGLGLGLSISKMLVEKMGGLLSAFSAGSGQGATFTVTLPTVAAPRARRAPLTACPPPETKPGALRILLVEDNLEIQELMAYQIQIMGHEVLTATSVGEALIVADSAPIDLMIADISLPDGTGWELMQRLQERHRPVRAIALSGFASPEDVEKSRSIGFIHHLSKPVSVAQLEQCIDSVMS